MSITILHPSGQGNVIFSSQPVSLELRTQEYADAHLAEFSAEFPGYKESAAGIAPVFGLEDGYVRRFSWAPNDGPALVQIQHYCIVGGRGYVATGTVALASIEVEPDVLNAMRQLRIEL